MLIFVFKFTRKVKFTLLCGHVDAINVIEFARSMLLSNAMALGSVWNLHDSFSLSNNDPFLSMETKVN